MTALACLLTVPAVMWLTQGLLRRWHGLPWRWRIDARDAPRSVRIVGRAVTQVAVLGVLLGFPILRGVSPAAYYGALLPPGPAVRQAGQGAAAAVLALALLFLAWIVAGRVRVEAHQSGRKWRRRLLLLLPTAAFGASVEELLFRGVLMADLLNAWPRASGAATAVTAAVFAAAHYVRAVKRRWTFPGHVLLGLLLSVAFLQTGALWLPLGLHAGGILMIMGTRPFFEYRGPAWLTGASIFPFAGGAGLLGLGVLTAWVLTCFGAGGE